MNTAAWKVKIQQMANGLVGEEISEPMKSIRIKPPEWKQWHPAAGVLSEQSNLQRGKSFVELFAINLPCHVVVEIVGNDSGAVRTD